jgi:O-antigen/teichoic acid export membrane protein
LCTIGTKILSGYQQTHLANLVTALGVMLSMVGLIVGVYVGFRMPLLFLCTSGLTTATGLAMVLWVVLVAKPWLRPRGRYLDPSLSSQLFRTGAPFFLIRIAGIVVFGTDNLVISHYLGADQVTPYSVTMRVVTYAQFIPALMFASLWASYAEANARGDLEWIRKTYARTMRSNSAAMLALLVILAVCGRPLIRFWAGAPAVPSEAMLLAMCTWTFILGFTGQQSCLLGGVGRTRVQAIAGILTAVVNLTLSVLLVQSLGAIGAVLATILSYVCIFVPQTREISRYLRGG